MNLGISNGFRFVGLAATVLSLSGCDFNGLHPAGTVVNREGSVIIHYCGKEAINYPEAKIINYSPILKSLTLEVDGKEIFYSGDFLLEVK